MKSKKAKEGLIDTDIGAGAGAGAAAGDVGDYGGDSGMNEDDPTSQAAGGCYPLLSHAPIMTHHPPIMTHHPLITQSYIL